MTRKTPGVDYTTGSLGNGLSIGVGMALAGRLRPDVYVLAAASIAAICRPGPRRYSCRSCCLVRGTGS